MLDEIDNSQITVATIATGKAMSCGAILLGYGTIGQRYAAPSCTIMLHDVSSEIYYTKNPDVKSNAKQIGKINKDIFRKLAIHCGHEDADYFLKIIHKKSHADWFIEPEEALKHRLIDHIGCPSLRIKIKFESILELIK